MNVREGERGRGCLCVAHSRVRLHASHTSFVACTGPYTVYTTRHTTDLDLLCFPISQDAHYCVIIPIYFSWGTHVPVMVSTLQNLQRLEHVRCKSVVLLENASSPKMKMYLHTRQ